jgi:hypothetical protein
LRKGDEQLILVSEYSMTAPTTTTFEVEIVKPSVVVDMETRKVIQKLSSSGAHRITATLRKSRAVLLYVGTRRIP